MNRPIKVYGNVFSSTDDISFKAIFRFGLSSASEAGLWPDSGPFHKFGPRPGVMQHDLSMTYV